MTDCCESPQTNRSTRVYILAMLSLFALALFTGTPNATAATAATADKTPGDETTSTSDPVATARVPQGMAMPVQRATMSAPLQGVLEKLLVKDGDRVKKGRILAVMDNRVAQAAVQSTRAAADRKAEIDHARHALALARSLLARHTALHDAQAGAEFELEQAQAQCNQAQATLDSALEAQLQARRNLELEEARLEAHNIRAPFDGQIVGIEATVGSTLTPQDKLLTIVCLDTLEAKLYLPLKEFGKLREGQSCRLWAFAPVNRSVSARLGFVSPMIDPASKTFRCVFTIDNKQRRLPAGFGVCLDPSGHETHHEDQP